MNKALALLFIIAFNLAPVAGVLFFQWEAFEAFWFFWLETLILALFNSVKIVFSQGRVEVAPQANIAMHYHVGKALRYLLIRIFIFVFYSIFIIVFIGFMANKDGDKLAVARTLVFQNQLFNLGLLISIVSQTYFLIATFFRNGFYLKADPNAFAALFDGRQIIIHVAVVLGTFASLFLAEHTDFGRFGGAAMIAILCVCKCIVELFNLRTETQINAIQSAG